MKLAITLLTLAMAGCSPSWMAGEASKVPVAVDTFCLQATRSWHPDDTDETIREARVFNETLARRCGRKAVKTS